MAFLKSLKNLEYKNTKVFIYYSIGLIKYRFQKNGEGDGGISNFLSMAKISSYIT